MFVGIGWYVYGYFLFNASIINPNPYYINLLHRAAQTCYIIVIIYGLLPIVFTAEKFSKKNYENIAIEFEFIKESLFVGLPILVIVVIVTQLLSHFQITVTFSLYDLYSRFWLLL
jgi:flagellar biosynthesis protein FlhB